MLVETKNNETIVKFPSHIKFDLIQDFIDYIEVKSLLYESKAKDAEIDLLAEESQENWWIANKSKFIH